MKTKTNYCISIRQPWAWLITHGFKDVENRAWNTKFRGPILIHASGSKTKQTYVEAQQFMADRGLTVELPPIEELPVKAIVGYTTILDVVTDSPSPWAMPDQQHWLLSPGKPITPIPYGGSHGIFSVDNSIQLPPFMGVQL